MPLEFLRSRACAELSVHGTKLLLDVLSMLGPNATRNGDISLAPKLMAVRGWSGRSTLNAAVKELEEHGLLVRTRQGGRLDCTLYALTLYPVNCDVKKLDPHAVGSYTTRDFTKAGANAPTEQQPAAWRQARKTQPVTPPRYEAPSERSATVQTPRTAPTKTPTLYRHGTKPPVFGPSIVPPRVTFLDPMSMRPEVGECST
ncbi:MAG: hypothetical protein QM777_16885 [Pseudorhodoferax sp.]